MIQSTLHNDAVFTLCDDTLTVVTSHSYEHTSYIKKWYARHKKRLGLFVLDPEIIDQYGNEASNQLTANTFYKVLLYEFPEQFTRKQVEAFIQKEQLLFVGLQGLCLLWEKQHKRSLSVMKKKRKKRIMALSLESGITPGAETVMSLERGVVLGWWNFRDYYITDPRDEDETSCYFNLVSLMSNLQKKTVFVFFKEL